MKKWIEIVLGTMLGLLLLFRGAELWVGSKIKKVATSELYRASDGVYKLDIGRVSVGLFDRSVKIRDITVETDSLHLDRLAMAMNARPEAERRYRPGLKLSVAELFIKGVYFKRHAGDVPTDSAAGVQTVADGLHRSISAAFDKLTVSRIRMRGVDGELGVRKEGDTVRYRIRRTTVEADDYDLNSDPSLNPFHFRDIRLTVRRLEHTYRFGSMTMCADTLAVSTARGIVSVKSLDITPNYEKTEFARRNPKHTDWTFCELGAITATGVDIAAAVYRKHLAADSVVIGRLDVGSYKDRNVERVEWVKSMFYEGLHKLPLTVDVRSIDVAAGSAFYEELPAGEPQSATVRFSDLKAKVYDLSNMAEPTAKNITVDASARLMSQGELKVRFLAPASPSDDRFEIIGSLGPVDMAAFNPLAEPLAKVRIDRGRIDKIDFHVTGVTRTSRVEMTMLYEGLYAMILKEDAPGETHDRKFLSELANDIVLRDSNPDGHGKLHHGSGTAERDMYKSQFNYMWRSLLPGIAESVGIPKALIHEKTADTSPGAHATPNEAKTHTGLIPMLLKSTSGD